MLCVGIRRRHGYADAMQTIARQWEDFRALGSIAGARDGVVYGIQCGAGSQDFEYMTAVEVADFAHASSDLGRIRVPAQKYAVFAVPHARAVPQTWMSIWNEWLPRSAFALANRPEFERYPDGFATWDTTPRIEIWASIVDRTS